MARTVKGTLTIEGQEIQITNPDKPLWPEVGITKAMYLQKLAAISPFLLRYCRGRLLTTIRYPHGVEGESFYQKNAPEPLPPLFRPMCTKILTTCCSTGCRSCSGWEIWLRLSFTLPCIWQAAICPANG